MIGSSAKTKQVYFFLMPEETSDVLSYIEEIGGVIYSNRSSSPNPSIFNPQEDIGQIYFSQQRDKDVITMKKVNNGVYILDPTVSPVIELQLSVLRNSELSRGRIYFRSGYMGREGWIPFDDSLSELFKQITAYMKRKFLSKEQKFDAYISHGARIYASDGGRLVQF